MSFASRVTIERQSFLSSDFDSYIVTFRAAKINQLIILTYCLKILIFYHTKILRYPKTIIIIVIITIYDKIKKVNDCYINLQLLLHHHYTIIIIIIYIYVNQRKQ